VRSKIVESPAVAVADVPRGASVFVGGFSVVHGWPSSLLLALRDLGVGDLTLICNSPGFGPLSPQVLGERNQVKKLLASFAGYPYRATPLADAIGRGQVELELVPQGTLAERARAGGAGLGGFFTPTGVGTVVQEGKEVREIDGRLQLFERALTADFAMVRAQAADPFGNLVFRGTHRNFNPAFASAGRVTVAEADEIVAEGDLDPNEIVTPSIFVDRVVRATVRPSRDEIMDLIRRLGRPAPETPPGLRGLPPDLMAMRAAGLFADGEIVNLGIGLPTLCANYLGGRNVTLHSQTGLVAYGAAPESGDEDLSLYDAGGRFVTALAAASVSDSCQAFAMARGGTVDKIVLGGFQVSEQGDLANWKTPSMAAGAIGGAMDLAAGGGEVIVLMYHTSKDGASKLLRRCTYPLTAVGCVSRIVTNLALVEVVRSTGFVLREIAPGVSIDEVRAATGAVITVASDVREMDLGG
jgi:3-oxoacid CoA-transferase